MGPHGIVRVTVTDQIGISHTSNETGCAHFDAIVIGAGFAGLYMLHKLRSMDMSAHIFESAGDVGGTWYWNRYPGARCDSESFLYSFSFSRELEQEWNWSERYAAQPEILRYLCHVADRFDLRRNISFNTKVISAKYDTEANRWTVETSTGRRAQSRFLMTAVGCHSARNLPTMQDLDQFQGRILHTASWPHEPVHFTGQRVGVIGTGSSGTQVIPEIAKEASHLNVFQRTPNFSFPARNRPLTEDEIGNVKRGYPTLRHLGNEGTVRGVGDVLLTPAQRKPVANKVSEVSADRCASALEWGWQQGGFVALFVFSESLTDPATNDAVAEFVRSKIRQIVKDPGMAETLSPKGYPIGAKRACMDTNYYETFNRPNVSLFDIRKNPIDRFTHNGLQLASGQHIELDSLVLATGFDMVTGPLLRLNITGSNGLRLADYWARGPKSYLGLGASGFPNLFTITGPLSPAALSNVVRSIEQHVNWIADCLEYMRQRHFTRIEADPAAEQAWQRTVLDTAASAVQTQADSWYVGANIPGKPRTILVYTGGESRYREICDAVRMDGYRGFLFR